MGRGNGGTILVHVGTNNTDKEGTTAIVEKYRKLLKKTKQARLGQIIFQRRTEAGTNNRCLRILVFYYRRRKDNPINTHRYKFIIAIIIATTRHISSTAYYTYPPGVALAM